MSKNSLILVSQNKQENPTIDIAKIQIKSEKLTPFGGIFSIMEQFTSVVAHVPQNVTTHLMKHLSLHPTLHTCSSDTILRAQSDQLPFYIYPIP